MRPLLLALLAVISLPLLRVTGSLSSDEASSVRFARLPLYDLATALCDPHPPGSYLLLKGWMMAGAGEIWLRALSLLAAVLAVVLTYRLARALCSRRCAGLAALLLALQPLFLWYAVEVRMYALVTALGVLLVWLGWRLLLTMRDGQMPAAVVGLYWLVAVTALFVDYTALLPFWLLQCVWIATRQDVSTSTTSAQTTPSSRRDTPARVQTWRWLALQAAVLAPFVLWWLASPQRLALRNNYHAVFLAIQANQLGLELTPSIARLILVVGGLLFAGISLIIAWQWPRWSRSKRQGWGWDLLVLLVWLLLLAFAAVPRLYTVKRLGVVLLPYLAILTAYVLARHRRWLAIGVVALGLAASLFVLTTHHRQPWRQVLTTINTASQGRSSVLWVDEMAAPVVDYYQPTHPTSPLAWTPLYGSRLPDLPELQPAPGADLWLLALDSPYRDLQPLLPVSFHAQYHLQESRHEQGIGVYRYQRRPQPLSQPPSVPEPSPQQLWGLQLPSPLDDCLP